MAEKYKNKYRVKSTRLRHWDYGWNAAYFVTICTWKHQHCFGNILERVMHVSKTGKTAQKFWYEIPNHFPFVLLDVFMVMPNHVHGIIIINKPDEVETQNFASLRGDDNKPKNQFGPQSQNLASIIRGYKSAVKKYATVNHIDFAWQPRFHDHIIRNQKSLETIREYVVNNPAKWHEDKYYGN